MNETPPGSSIRSSRIAPAPGSAVILPPSGLSAGPETVLNPDARPIPPDQLTPAEIGPVSEVATVLFPAATGSGSHFPGPQGVIIGHFRIESCIRSGGMGAVFKAVDIRLNRVVALKVLPPSHSRDPAIVQRFRHEAQAVAQLDHENIAQVHFIGEDQGLHFIAFEFINGTNLRDLIQQQGTIPPEDAVNYTLQIAHALVHTNEHGVVHRDIKPSNIIIMPQGRAKLVDLGLARNENRDPSDQLTVAGTTLGTFDYISPEQAKDPRSVDVRSDLYSLGCTLYHMLTGEAPYAEGTMLQKLLDHQAKDVPDPRRKNRLISADLSAIVQKMMAPDPLGRYQTPTQLIRDLLYVAEGLGLQSLANDGQVWMATQPIRQTFFQRHSGWMIPTVVLMAFVLYLKFSDDRITTSQSLGLSTNPSTQRTPGSQLTPGLGSEKRPADDSNPPTVNSAPNNSTPDLAHSTPNPPEKQIAPFTASNNSTTPSVPESGLATSKPGSSTQDNLTPLVPRPEGEPNQTNFPPRLFESIPPLTIPPDSKSANVNRTPDNPSDSSQPGPKPGTIPGSAPSNTEPPVVAATEGRRPKLPALDEAAPFSLLGSGGSSERLYPTLEAACSDAVDGSIIELRFDGIRREKPIRITRKITIRAAPGSKPELQLSPTENSTDRRLISILGGSLLLVDINLIVSQSDQSANESWLLFSVQRGEQLRLENCGITLHSNSISSPVVVEFRPSPPDTLLEMDSALPLANRPPFRVDLQNSMIRGTGDVFLVKHASGVRLSVKNCVVALSGQLLRSEGTSDAPRSTGLIELQLNQNTLVVNGGLLSLNAGNPPRTLSRIDVSAENNIITASKQSSTPLVSMSGNVPQDDLNRLLGWSGLKNFYYPFDTYWTTQSTNVTGKRGSLKFSDWTRHWGVNNEVDAHDGLIIWLERWSEKPLESLVPGDFALDPSVANINPAIAGANDGGDAGVDLDLLHNLRIAPFSPATPGTN